MKVNLGIIDNTDADSAVFVAWLGDFDVPLAYWPDDDGDAFR